jgi:hypothetical protein
MHTRSTRARRSGKAYPRPIFAAQVYHPLTLVENGQEVLVPFSHLENVRVEGTVLRTSAGIENKFHYPTYYLLTVEARPHHARLRISLQPGPL